MNVHAQPPEPAFAAQLHRQERKSLLRFIACGSVDHGKSTLIGRLLYDSKQVFDDQLDALKADSRKFGTQGGDLDFSLLLDGLAAERERNITIDVAPSWSMTLPRRSECRLSSVSWMISGTERAVLSMAPVSG